MCVYGKRATIKRELASLALPKPCLRTLPGSPTTKKKPTHQKDTKIEQFLPDFVLLYQIPCSREHHLLQIKIDSTGIRNSFQGKKCTFISGVVLRWNLYTLAKGWESALGVFLSQHVFKQIAHGEINFGAENTTWTNKPVRIRVQRGKNLGIALWSA